MHNHDCLSRYCRVDVVSIPVHLFLTVENAVPIKHIKKNNELQYNLQVHKKDLNVIWLII